MERKYHSHEIDTTIYSIYLFLKIILEQIINVKRQRNAYKSSPEYFVYRRFFSLEGIIAKRLI